MRRQSFIDAAQEVMCVERVVFPGVFAVEDHGDRPRRTVRMARRNGLETGDEIRGGIIAMPARVREADPVGQLIVTEKTGRPVASKAKRPVPDGDPLGRRSLRKTRRQTGRQYRLPARHPVETFLAEQAHRVLADRTLRRPAAARHYPEGGGTGLARPARVPAGARHTAGVGHRRQRSRWLLLPGGVDVDQQRQDRVTPRRDGDFDLAPLSKPPVARDDPGDQPTDDLEQFAPVDVIKAVCLVDEARDPWFGAPYRLTEPRKVIPDRDPAEEIRRHRIGGANRLGVCGELPERRKTVDQVFALGAQALLQQVMGPPGLGRQAARAERGKERVGQGGAIVKVRRDGRGIGRELLEQDRREVDYRARTGNGLQMRRHIGIVLDRVQIGPRQRELATAKIPVLGLVHVPAQHNVQRCRAGRPGG